MKFILLISIILTFVFNASGQKDPSAYALFNSEGKSVKWKKIIETSLDADVLFFGELHDNSIDHWLQRQLMEDLFTRDSTALSMGAEMFETDNQLIIDEYLSKSIDDKRFEEGARLWGNYQTDYKGLLVFARNNNIDFFATNIPRRYANMVLKGGFESLESVSAEAQKLIAPLPIAYDAELSCYEKMRSMNMGHGMNMDNFPKAQAIKDASMAYFIQKNIEKDGLFVHFNGAYHSDFHEGIVWYLNEEDPGLNIVTISTVLQKNISSLSEENYSRADFIIVIPEDMTRSY